MTITNGTVSIEDGKKAAEEYAPARKVRVDISFSVPEGEDGEAHLIKAGDTAHNHVARLINYKGAIAATPAADVKPVAAKGKKPPVVANPAPEKTKDDLAREAGIPNKDTVHKAAEVDELDAPAKSVEKDEMEDLLGDAAPAPVTDAELGKAAQEKNGDMKDKPGWAPSKIRDLVGKFVQVDGKPKPGAKINEIPAAARHDFLAQLKALK